MRIAALLLLPLLLGATTASFPAASEIPTLPLFAGLSSNEGLFAGRDTWTPAGQSAIARNSLVVIDGIVGGWVYGGFFATFAAPTRPEIITNLPAAAADPLVSQLLVSQLLVNQPVESRAARFNPDDSSPTIANPEPGSEFLVLLPLALLVALRRLKRA
jgi:hypothetical protein